VARSLLRHPSGPTTVVHVRRWSGPLVHKARQRESYDVYAIVRAGGRQEKVAVGDILVVDRLTGAPGDETRFTPVLLVDGATVTSDADSLASLVVSGEIVEDLKGPKISILKYKNKTGYRKRQGYRSHLTKVKITTIGKEQVS